MLREGLWREVLEARYDNWRNINASKVHKKHSLWWQDLCRVCGKEPQDNWFDCRLLWVLG